MSGNDLAFIQGGGGSIQKEKPVVIKDQRTYVKVI